tara:strand:- start:317 stop:463 length:147 start_codon:yes stop_codon:yes gene_type:complete
MTKTVPVMGAVFYCSIDFYEEKGASHPRQAALPQSLFGKMKICLNWES